MCGCECCVTKCTSTRNKWCGCTCQPCVMAYGKAVYHFAYRYGESIGRAKDANGDIPAETVTNLWNRAHLWNFEARDVEGWEA